MQKLIIDIGSNAKLEELKKAIGLLKGVDHVYTEKEYEKLENKALIYAIDEGRNTDFVNEEDVNNFLDED